VTALPVRDYAHYKFAERTVSYRLLYFCPFAQRTVLIDLVMLLQGDIAELLQNFMLNLIRRLIVLLLSINLSDGTLTILFAASVFTVMIILVLFIF